MSAYAGLPTLQPPAHAWLASKAMTTAPNFESYDPELAELMRSSDESVAGSTGLPGYLGIRTTAVGPGTFTAEVEVRPELLNPFGAAHGGVLAGLVDHVLGAAVLPLIPRGSWPATGEFKVNFLAPVREGTLCATAEVVSLSRRTVVVRIEATNADRLVGVAQGTVAITPPKSSS